MSAAGDIAEARDGAAASAPDLPRPRRRWRLVAAVLAIVAVVGGGAAFDHHVFSAEPLQRGSSMGYDGEHRMMSPPGGNDSIIYRYRAGATFTHTFDVMNRGDLAIRVVDLPQPITRGYHAERISVMTGDGGQNERRGGAPDRWVPLAPFDLAPGEYRLVTVTYRFRTCTAPPLSDDSPREVFNGGVSWDDLPVRIEILGVDREYAMPLGHTVALEGAHGTCRTVPKG